ncbi:hypothetical protein KUCAC02_000854, partial [Chaenocephalus aceratus]
MLRNAALSSRPLFAFALVCAAVMSFIVCSEAARVRPITTQVNDGVKHKRLKKLYIPRSQHNPIFTGQPSTQTGRQTGTTGETETSGNSRVASSIIYQRPNPTARYWSAPLPTSRGNYKEVNEPPASGARRKFFGFSSQPAPHPPSVSNSLDAYVIKSIPSPEKLTSPHKDFPQKLNSVSSSELPRNKKFQSYLFKNSLTSGHERVHSATSDGPAAFFPPPHQQQASDSQVYSRSNRRPTFESSPKFEPRTPTKVVGMGPLYSSTSSTVRGTRVKGNKPNRFTNESGKAVIVRLPKTPARAVAVTYADVLGSASFSGVKATTQTPSIPADKEYFPNATATTEQKEGVGNWSFNSEDAEFRRENTSRGSEDHEVEDVKEQHLGEDVDVSHHQFHTRPPTSSKGPQREERVRGT